MMHGIEALPRVQLLQETLDLFTLRVFVDDPESHAGAAEFVRLLKMELGGGAVVNISYEKPERLRAKFRPVLSRVPEPQLTAVAPR